MEPRPDDDEIMKTLKTLRDEVRVRLHLAGMEARDAFHRIEKEVDGATREVKSELIQQLEKLRRAIPSGK